MSRWADDPEGQVTKQEGGKTAVPTPKLYGQPSTPFKTFSRQLRSPGAERPLCPAKCGSRADAEVAVLVRRRRGSQLSPYSQTALLKLKRDLLFLLPRASLGAQMYAIAIRAEFFHVA